MGDEITEKLDFEPARLFVRQEIRRKYVCQACEAAAAETARTSSPLKSRYLPSRRDWRRRGSWPRSSSANMRITCRCTAWSGSWNAMTSSSAVRPPATWMAACAETLKPLYQLMVQEVLQSRVIHTDDTPVDVLDRDYPGTTKTGRLWDYIGDADHPQTVFDYTPSRSRDGPMKFLAGWGKDRPVFPAGRRFRRLRWHLPGRSRRPRHRGCLSCPCPTQAVRRPHFRRGHQRQALAYIRLLYDVEDQAQALADTEADPQARRRKLVAERLRLRQELSVPRLAQYKAWLESCPAARGGPVLPKSPMGQAIAYTLNQWEALCVYTRDGELNIDNNVSERNLRRIASGRNYADYAVMRTGQSTGMTIRW